MMFHACNYLLIEARFEKYLYLGTMTQPAETSTFQAMRKAFSTFVSDVGRGVFTLTHSGLAMVGLTLALAWGVAVYRPDLLNEAENTVYSLLRDRQFSLWWEPQNTADRATATDLKDIPRKQAAVAAWLASKYRVAPEPIAALVSEAYVLSESSRLKPHLILAVMAIESSFHPYVQSQAGAQGLMQVMTAIHKDKYALYGGTTEAVKPEVNIRVGAYILKYLIATAGSLRNGLKFYVGAANLDDDGGYAGKVMAEHGRLLAVIAGKQQSFESQPVPQAVPVSYPATPRTETTRPLALMGS